MPFLHRPALRSACRCIAQGRSPGVSTFRDLDLCGQCRRSLNTGGLPCFVQVRSRPASRPLPAPRWGCSFERINFLSLRRRVDDASTALCLSSPCCPDPSPTPTRKLSVSVHDWMGFAPRHLRDGSTPSSGTGGNTPDAINSVLSHLLPAYSRPQPRVATNASPNAQGKGKRSAAFHSSRGCSLGPTFMTVPGK